MDDLDLPRKVLAAVNGTKNPTEERLARVLDPILADASDGDLWAVGKMRWSFMVAQVISKEGRRRGLWA